MKIEFELASVLSAVIKTFGCNITRLQCSYAGGADSWIHFFDLKALPANGANPDFALKMFAGATRFDEFTDLNFVNGCVIAVSTTQATLTIASAGAEITGLVEGDTSVDDTDWLTAGDYTTAEDELIVWDDASGPKFLMRLEITNLTDAGAARYVHIRARNSASSYLAALFPKRVFTLGATSSLDSFFGSSGFSPFEDRGAVSISDGCVVSIGTYDSATGVFTVDATPNYAIKASYKESIT